MIAIEITTNVDASPTEVWDRLRDLAGHVAWMADAEAIRFDTDQTAGVGTAFECDTRVGPLRTTDHMTVTAWEPERTIGVDHVGVVRGSGRFTMRPSARGGTRLTWTEQLVFPWWLGGGLGEQIGAPVLRHVWSGNLTRLQDLVEAG